MNEKKKIVKCPPCRVRVLTTIYIIGRREFRNHATTVATADKNSSVVLSRENFEYIDLPLAHG